MADDRWQMTDDRWQMTDGRRQMTDGRWQMADGGRQRTRSQEDRGRWTEKEVSKSVRRSDRGTEDGRTVRRWDRGRWGGWPTGQAQTLEKTFFRRHTLLRSSWIFPSGSIARGKRSLSSCLSNERSEPRHISAGSPLRSDGQAVYKFGRARK